MCYSGDILRTARKLKHRYRITPPPPPHTHIYHIDEPPTEFFSFDLVFFHFHVKLERRRPEYRVTYILRPQAQAQAHPHSRLWMRGSNAMERPPPHPLPSPRWSINHWQKKQSSFSFFTSWWLAIGVLVLDFVFWLGRKQTDVSRPQFYYSTRLKYEFLRNVGTNSQTLWRRYVGVMYVGVT